MSAVNERVDMTEGTVKARVAVKAAATAIDAGAFTAIAAAYTIDRDKEFIRPGAFKNTISAWQGRDRPIPLHWAHKGEPENIIGTVDPHTMAETDDGLYVEGQLDLKQSGNAGEAWRLVKAGVVGLSFGFLGTMGEKSEDGSREIVDVDLFEVSLTPAPANPDTKILSWKSVEEPTPDVETLKKESQALERHLIADTLPEPAEEIPQDPIVDVETFEALQAERDALQEKVTALEAEPEKSAEELKKESAKVARELIEADLPEPAEPEPEPTVKELEALLVETAEQMRQTQQRHLGMLAVFAGIKELPDDVKESLTDQERQILDMAGKKAEETARGRKARSVDPLLKEAQKAELDRLVGSRDLPKPPEKGPEPEPLDAKRLRKESRETMLALLTGARK